MAFVDHLIFDDKIEVDGQEVETADVHADVRIK